MARILFLVFLAFLAWLAVRVLGAKRSQRDADPPAPTPEVPPRAVIEPIAQCAWCGMHVPTGSALALPDGRIYCGAPHRDAARAAAGSDAPT